MSMRTGFFLPALLLPTVCGAADLHVSIEGSPPGAAVMVALHDSAAGFAERSARRQLRVGAGVGTRRLTFTDLAPGRYALAAYADLNGNLRLDSNFLGLPSEPYGFSRDARGRLGVPDFADAAFAVGEADVEHTLHLR